jgi:hypothetical protein
LGFFHISLWINTMNRCRPLAHVAPRRALCLALACAALLPLNGGAQGVALSQPVRRFPLQTQRAQMVVLNTQDVTLNGTPARLSPGTRIRNTQNMLVTSGTLVGQTLIVNFVRDAAGQVHEVWLLNEAEAAERRPGSEGITTTNIVTGSGAAQ